MDAPSIDSYTFTQIVIDGQTYEKDVLILPDRIISRWWRQEGHLLQTVDLEPVLASQLTHLIVGTGAYGKMKISAQVEEALQSAGIELIVLPTTEAWQKYNELRDTGQVAGAFHITC